MLQEYYQKPCWMVDTCSNIMSYNDKFDIMYVTFYTEKMYKYYNPFMHNGVQHIVLCVCVVFICLASCVTSFSGLSLRYSLTFM